MTDDRKLIEVHQIVTGRRKVIILLPSNGTEKLIPDVLCQIKDKTVSLEMTHMQI